MHSQKVILASLAFLLMGCLPEEVSFSSANGNAGQTVTVNARLRVYNPNIGGIQNDFRIDPPLYFSSCTKSVNVDPVSSVSLTGDNLWRASMLADTTTNIPWPKGPRTLYSCIVQIPANTPSGDYFIHSLNIGGSSDLGKLTPCVEKAGGKVHVNS